MAGPDPHQARLKRWWPLALTALLVTMLFCPCCVFIGYLWLDMQRDQTQQRWEKLTIKKGMTQDELRAIMGEPDLKYDDHWSYIIHLHRLAVFFKDGHVEHVQNGDIR